jgi:hypothetical protein
MYFSSLDRKTPFCKLADKVKPDLQRRKKKDEGIAQKGAYLKSSLKTWCRCEAKNKYHATAGSVERSITAT